MSSSSSSSSGGAAGTTSSELWDILCRHACGTATIDQVLALLNHPQLNLTRGNFVLSDAYANHDNTTDAYHTEVEQLITACGNDAAKIGLVCHAYHIFSTAAVDPVWAPLKIRDLFTQAILVLASDHRFSTAFFAQICAHDTVRQALLKDDSDERQMDFVRAFYYGGGTAYQEEKLVCLVRTRRLFPDEVNYDMSTQWACYLARMVFEHNMPMLEQVLLDELNAQSNDERAEWLEEFVSKGLDDDMYRSWLASELPDEDALHLLEEDGDELRDELFSISEQIVNGIIRWFPLLLQDPHKQVLYGGGVLRRLHKFAHLYFAWLQEDAANEADCTLASWTNLIQVVMMHMPRANFTDLPQQLFPNSHVGPYATIIERRYVEFGQAHQAVRTYSLESYRHLVANFFASTEQQMHELNVELIGEIILDLIPNVPGMRKLWLGVSTILLPPASDGSSSSSPPEVTVGRNLINQVYRQYHPPAVAPEDQQASKKQKTKQ
jgi:hypothetical protein